MIIMLLAGGLIYYLLKSWNSKAITLVGRRGMKIFLRDSQPFPYWFTVILYIATGAFVIIELCFRVCEILKLGGF